MGSLLSISIIVLVIIYLTQKTISLVDMSDPSIQSYKRPLYVSEVSDIGNINLAQDYHFNFGVFIRSTKTKSDLIIPENLGRIVSETRVQVPN